MSKMQLTAAAVLALGTSSAIAGISANGAVSNNYIWRGLTQTVNEAAVSGGIDWAGESGLYAGTWVSNVKYASDDIFSYEHDLYIGFSGGDELSYDFGWLYYNYDEAAEFDFHEIYGSLGYGGLSFTAYVLSGTEADDGGVMDFDFGSTTYMSLDYGFDAGGMAIGLHVGQHAGDFNEAFNGVPGDYVDYNVTFGVSDFTLMISGTDLEDAGDADVLDNDALKFVISYGAEWEI